MAMVGKTSGFDHEALCFPISKVGKAVASINHVLANLTFKERVEVIKSLAYCIYCGDKLRGPCSCMRDE